MLRPRSYTFRVESLLAAAPAAVWARITTMRGVNAELLPLARMTYPPEAERIDVATVPLGQRLFRSWILLFGFLPVEYDDLSFEAIDPGRGFREVSTLLSQRRWVHQRTIEPVGSGCRLTDQLELEPRLRLLGPVYLPVFRWFFAHRHRRLRRHFGTLDAS